MTSLGVHVVLVAGAKQCLIELHGGLYSALIKCRHVFSYGRSGLVCIRSFGQFCGCAVFFRGKDALEKRQFTKQAIFASNPGCLGATAASADLRE